MDDQGVMYQHIQTAVKNLPIIEGGYRGFCIIPYFFKDCIRISQYSKKCAYLSIGEKQTLESHYERWL